MEEYIELWTCYNGIKLLSDNRNFAAWEEDHYEWDANCFPIKVKSEFLTKGHSVCHINYQDVVEVCGHAIRKARIDNGN